MQGCVHVEKKKMDIMLMAISQLSRNVSNVATYSNDFGEEDYVAVHTNEAGVFYVQDYLRSLQQERSLSRIYCLCTDSVKNKPLESATLDKVEELTKRKYREGSSYSFLVQRVLEKNPELEGRFVSQDCQELTESADALMQDIGNVTQEILKLQGENMDCQLVIHADITGAFRHTGIMVMNIMQLLRYYGIEIGLVLYTEVYGKKIYRINNMQNLFLLLNGVDEFVRNGNVGAFKEYVAQDMPEKSPVLEHLIQAMENFSIAIRLCMPNAIVSITKDLKVAVRQFIQKHNRKNIQEDMLAKIMQKVEEEYSSFWDEKKDEDDLILEIIHWCMRKDLWQQAMTFGMELLPLYICHKDIVSPKNKEDRNTNDFLHPHWETVFVIDPSKVKLPEERKKELNRDATEQVKQGIQDVISRLQPVITAKVQEPAAGKPAVDKFLGELRDIDEILDKAKEEMRENERKRKKSFPQETFREHPLIFKLLKFFYMRSGERNGFEGFVRSRSGDEIANWLLTLKGKPCYFEEDEIAVLLKSCYTERTLREMKKEQEEALKKETNGDSFARKELRWGILLDEHRVRCAYPKKKKEILGLLRHYDALRDIRNTINHASEGEGRSLDVLHEAERVKQAINTCLKDIRDIMG